MRLVDAKRVFPPVSPERQPNAIHGDGQDVLAMAFGKVQPDITVNCIGLIKHHPEADDAILESHPIIAAASTGRVMLRCQGSIDPRRQRLCFFGSKGRICRGGSGGLKRPVWEGKTLRRAASSTYDYATDIGDLPRITRIGWGHIRHVLNAESRGPWSRRLAAESGFPSHQLQQEMESSCGF